MRDAAGVKAGLTLAHDMMGLIGENMRKWFAPAILAVLCVAVFTSGMYIPVIPQSASLPTPTILIIPTLHPLPTLVAASTPSSTASIPPTSTPLISVLILNPKR